MTRAAVRTVTGIIPVQEHSSIFSIAARKGVFAPLGVLSPLPSRVTYDLGR